VTGGDLGFGPCHGQLLSTLFVGVVLGRKIGYAVVSFVLGGALMSPINAWRTYLVVFVVWCGVLDHLGGIFFSFGRCFVLPLFCVSGSATEKLCGGTLGCNEGDRVCVSGVGVLVGAIVNLVLWSF
jgi:hypothetical protein